MQLLASIAGLPLLQSLNLSWLGSGNPVGGVLGELAACRSSSLTSLVLTYSNANAETVTRYVYVHVCACPGDAGLLPLGDGVSY